MQNDIKGYRPVDKDMTYDPKESDIDDVVYDYDPDKLYYIEKLVLECKGKTHLIFVASPYYNKNYADDVYAPLISLAQKYNVPFLNHNNDTTYSYRKDYFYDSVHLNRKGATAYTQEIMKEVKHLLQMD